MKKVQMWWLHIYLHQSKRHQGNQRKAVHGQRHGIVRDELTETQHSGKPGRDQSNARGPFVQVANCLVALVDAKVWVQKDTSGNAQSNAVDHDANPAPRVRRL